MSMYDLNVIKKKFHKTELNAYSMFPIGTKVKVICAARDFNFFFGETGVVIKNDEKYLGIIVKWDIPRKYENGHIEYEWNFKPEDLVILENNK